MTRQCPRCHVNQLIHLKSMQRYDSRNWFKCDGCDHIVTESPIQDCGTKGTADAANK